MTDQPYQPYQPGEPYQPQQPAGPPSRKGFIGGLLDISFTTYITPMVVGVVYVLGIAALAFAYLVMLVAGFTDSFGAGIAVLVIGPVVLVIYLVLWRMMLEFYVAVTRMADDIHRRLPQA